MKKSVSNVNVLTDNPYLCIVKIGSPLLVTYILNILTVSLLQKVYSASAGGEYFLITGLLTGITSSIPAIYTSVASAAWIKTAGKAVLSDVDEKKRALWDGYYAIIFISAVLFAILALFSDTVLGWLNIPAEVYSATKSFYLLTVGLYLFTGLASFSVAVVNGVSSVWTILLINSLNVCAPLLMAFLLLTVFKTGMAGAAAVTGSAMLLVVLAGFAVLRKNGYKGFKAGHFVPRIKNILEIISFGGVLALQSIFCFVGAFFLSLQANRHLGSDYLSVLSVTIPIASAMGIFSSVIHALVPVNYAAGNIRRVKQIFRGCIVFCVAYGFVCFGVYALAGRAYFSTLFEDPNIVDQGVSFWFWQGAGYVFVAVIFVVRIFFESIGKKFIALFSGVFEMAGLLICAFCIIPLYGEIGFSIGNPLGWALATVYLLSAYLVLRRKIYQKK